MGKTKKNKKMHYKLSLRVKERSKKISPQSFADTAHSEITSILHKTALEILIQIDPFPHTRTTAKPHVKPSYHHSSEDPKLCSNAETKHDTTPKCPRHSTKRFESRRRRHAPYHQNKMKQEQKTENHKRKKNRTNC